MSSRLTGGDAQKKRQMSAQKMHFDHHNSPKIKNKVNRASKDLGISSPSKLEDLRDSNIQLKRKKGDLETEVKVIET